MRFEIGDLMAGVVILAFGGAFIAILLAIFGVWEPRLAQDIRKEIAEQKELAPTGLKQPMPLPRIREPRIWIDPLTECHWIVSSRGEYFQPRTDYKGRHICFERPDIQRPAFEVPSNAG